MQFALDFMEHFLTRQNESSVDNSNEDPITHQNTISMMNNTTRSFRSSQLENVSSKNSTKNIRKLANNEKLSESNSMLNNMTNVASSKSIPSAKVTGVRRRRENKRFIQKDPQLI